MNYKPSTIATMKIVRLSSFGAFLDAETGDTSDDILLHKTQWKPDFKPKIGDKIEVFLYLDPKRRLTASMNLPKVKIGESAKVRVINLTRDGAFLDFEAERGIFMPFSEMDGEVNIGDEVTAKLYVDKSGRLAATMNIDGRPRISPVEIQRKNANQLVRYMRENHGRMHFSDHSSPKDIMATFGISKVAFKNALGFLLKTGRIKFENNETVLIQK